MSRSKILAVIGLTSSLLSTSAVAEVTPHMVSDWGKQIVDLLDAVERLSAEPSKAAQTGLGLAGAAAGAKVGSSLGGALIGWAVGDDYKPVGNVLGALFGAGLGKTGGESIGATADQARNFLIKDQELLTKIDTQLTVLQNEAAADSDAAGEISKLDNETRVELAAINNALPTWYNPATIADVRKHIPMLADNAQILSKETDRLSQELTGN